MSSNPSFDAFAISSIISVYGLLPVKVNHLDFILSQFFFLNLLTSSLVAHANICVTASCICPSFLKFPIF